MKSCNKLLIFLYQRNALTEGTECLLKRNSKTFFPKCVHMFLYIHMQRVKTADKQLLNGMIDNVSDEMGHQNLLVQQSYY